MEIPDFFLIGVQCYKFGQVHDTSVHNIIHSLAVKVEKENPVQMT